jgi:hypothetical protein
MIGLDDRIGQEIAAAYDELHHAIRTRDRELLESLHDPEFLGAELPGNLITAEEHVQTTMNSRSVELRNLDLRVKGLTEDIALAWGRQTLKGHLEPDDPGTTPEMAAQIADGIVFSFLGVWRRSGGKWRLLTFQGTKLDVAPSEVV